MNLTNLWTLQGQLLLILAVGVILRRIGLYPSSGNTSLTDFIIYVTLPCSIVVSFLMEIGTTDLFSFGLVFIISVLIQFFCYGLSKVLFRKQQRPRRSVLRYGILVSNSMFIGLPIAGELFGSLGVIYASMYLIPLRVVMWTAGLSSFSVNSISLKHTIKKIAFHPCIIAIYIGLFLLLSQLSLPAVVERTMVSIGACTTPLSMVLIGGIIGGIDRKEIRIDLLSLLLSSIRLLLIPFAAYLGCIIFAVDPIVTGVSVVLAGMPVGVTTPIIAGKYGGDAAFASRLVTICTILSMITIPLWALIL